MPQKVKKLVQVWAISILIIKKKKKKKEKLERVLYICHPITFKDQTKALLNSESKINAINQTFTF